MSNKFKDLIMLAVCTVTLTLAVWLPHILALPNFWGLSFKEGFSTIDRNYDGLEYIAIAKSFYNPDILNSLPMGLSANYFASHFPGYSLLISLLAPFFGYLKSMLIVAIISTILATWVFYLLVYNFRLSSHPLFLSLLFLILPARWLIVHSVGSSEPTFILFTLSAIYFFMKFEQSSKFSYILLAGGMGALAQLTRPPGILLFIAIGCFLIWKVIAQKAGQFVSLMRIIVTYSPLILIPLALLTVFFWYSLTYQDFFAYFKSGDNIHLTFPPFQVFNKHQFWVGEAWLEDIVYIFILGFLGGVLLIKQKLYPMAFFVVTFLAAAIFVAHRDISRYVLPVTPFVLIAFEKVLTSKEFKIISPLIFLAIYLYAQNFILQNAAPIPNLAPFN
ncbi:glycosyltransferase family 39 protein [Candidatus Daviesbacteria bacterium]|nr:glycosyltransferase family 39 protein [Candidatus Daviesbacteria bacterium]